VLDQRHPSSLGQTAASERETHQTRSAWTQRNSERSGPRIRRASEWPTAERPAAPPPNPPPEQPEVQPAGLRSCPRPQPGTSYFPFGAQVTRWQRRNFSTAELRLAQSQHRRCPFSCEPRVDSCSCSLDHRSCYEVREADHTAENVYVLVVPTREL